MADGKFEIKVDIISDPNAKGKAKRIVDDLERDVIASQKRIAASSKATDRAILSSQKTASDASTRIAKQQASELIRELKRTESAAKTSSTSIQGYLKSAFGGGLIGGAIGGFAGGIAGQITSQLSQLPSFFKTQVDEMIRIASERQNAFKGLQSMSQFLGISSKDTQDAVRNLRLVRAGVVEIGDATIGLKNLLMSGFSLPESIKLLEAFSDTAAFGKSAALGFGEAIRGATEGIRNGNSILVDNVGLTKNLSIILKQAGFEEKDLMRVKEDHNVRQALFNGLLKEALPQMGDADKLTKGWTGSTAALTQAQTNLYAAVGDVIINNKELIALVNTLTNDLNENTAAIQNTETGWKKSINSMTSTFADFVNTVNLGVRKEIADLQELVNIIETAAYGLAALGTDLGTGWTTAGAERIKEYQDRKAKIGTFYSSSQTYERNYLDNYNRNVVRQMGLTPGYNPVFGKPLGNFRDELTQKPSTAFSGYTIGADGLTLIPKKAASSTLGGDSSGSGKGAKKPKNLLPEFGSMRSLVISSGNPQWDSWFTQMGHKFGVDPNVLLLQASGESSFKAGAISPKGAKGFSQFMPDTAKRFGVDVTSVKDSIRGQAQYMSQLLSMFGGDYAKALAGYNAGEGAVQKYGGIPPYKETRGYVAKIRGAYGRRVRKDAGEFGTYDYGDEASPFITAGDTTIGTEIDLSKREKELAIGKRQVEVYEDLYRALAELNGLNKEEEFLLDVKLGKYKEFTDTQLQEIANTYKLIDAKETQKKADEENKRALEDYAREQERIFDDTRQGFEDLFNDLADGNFKNIWDRMRRQMLDMFIKPASQYLAQLFSGVGAGFGGMQPAMSGGFGMPSFGGGGMGPGGTPMFNGGSFNFSGGQGGGFRLPTFNFGRRSAASPGGQSMLDLNTISGTGMDLMSSAGGGGISGWFRGMGGGSRMAGIGSGIGAGLSMLGSAVGGKWGNTLSLAGTGAMIGANFGPWGALIGGAIGGAAGLISMLFGRSNLGKKLKEAALSNYGITIKDKSVLNSLKKLGESMFGKRAADNADAVVTSDEGQLILRNYAEASGQSSEKIDRLYIGDENWKGNQFVSKFGGFRASGGPVKAGKSYIVGERGPEMFTPKENGAITPNGAMGDPSKMLAMLGQLEETINYLASRLQGVNPGQVLAMGAKENPDAITDAWNQMGATDLRFGERTLKSQGAY